MNNNKNLDLQQAAIKAITLAKKPIEAVEVAMKLNCGVSEVRHELEVLVAKGQLEKDFNFYFCRSTEKYIEYSEAIASQTWTQEEQLNLIEKAVKQREKGAFEIGGLLSVVRDRKLYRLEFDTFAQYCEAVFGYSKSHCNRLIAAFEVYQNLRDNFDTHGCQNKKAILPSSERQIRDLAKLPWQEQSEAWSEALELTHGKPTAKLISKIAKEKIMIRTREEADCMIEDINSNILPKAKITKGPNGENIYHLEVSQENYHRMQKYCGFYKYITHNAAIDNMLKKGDF